MLYQNYVSFYSSLASAGESHSNQRHTTIYRTGFALNEITLPGQGLIGIGNFDHSRLSVALPTIANATTDKLLVINHRQEYLPNYNYTRNFIGDTLTETRFEYPVGWSLRLMERGVMWSRVDKAINPALPVFLRVANGASPFQLAGNFTDTADGANTVQVRGAFWFGSDSVTYLQTKDANITQQFEAERCGLTGAYSVAPIQLISRAVLV